MLLTTDALLEQLELYVGWRYSLQDPRYPAQLPGVRLPPAPPKQTNCCAFVEGLVIGAAVRAGINVPWNVDTHRRAVVAEVADRRGPTEVLVDVDLADIWDTSRGPPPSWSVCQGWKGPRGHTFIIADTHDNGPATGVLLLEANRGRGINGVGWRGHGPARASKIPTLWYRDSRVWTWNMLQDTYPELSVAALHVAQTPKETLDKLKGLPEPFIPGKPEGGGSIRS